MWSWLLLGLRSQHKASAGGAETPGHPGGWRVRRGQASKTERTGKALRPDHKHCVIQKASWAGTGRESPGAAARWAVTAEEDLWLRDEGGVRGWLPWAEK